MVGTRERALIDTVCCCMVQYVVDDEVQFTYDFVLFRSGGVGTQDQGGDHAALSPQGHPLVHPQRSAARTRWSVVILSSSIGHKMLKKKCLRTKQNCFVRVKSLFFCFSFFLTFCALIFLLNCCCQLCFRFLHTSCLLVLPVTTQ